MNEEFGSEYPSPFSTEFTKALVDKMVGHGTELKNIGEQIRRLPNPIPTMEGIDQRTTELANSLTQLAADIKKLEGSFAEIPQRLSGPIASVERLGQQLQQHTEQMAQHAQLFEKPLKKSVHYTHFMGKPVLVIAILILIIAAESMLWNRSSIQAGQHSENDIKWRAARLSNDTQVSKKLDEIQAVYHANTDLFTKEVIEEEDRLQKLFEQFTQKQHAEQEILQLQENKKTIP
jgi:transcriptional regulator of heat shock response